MSIDCSIEYVYHATTYDVIMRLEPIRQHRPIGYIVHYYTIPNVCGGDQTGGWIGSSFYNVTDAERNIRTGAWVPRYPAAMRYPKGI